MNVMMNILKDNAIFAGFADGELMLLVQMCEPVTFGKGEVIFAEGSLDDNAAYFIEEGVIKIVKQNDGQRKVLAMFGLGNVFGEMSFFSPGARSATAVADERAVLHKLVPAKFQELESNAPTTAIKLLKVFINKIITRLRQTDEALMQPRGQKIIIT